MSLKPEYHVPSAPTRKSRLLKRLESKPNTYLRVSTYGAALAGATSYLHGLEGLPEPFYNTFAQSSMYSVVATTLACIAISAIDKIKYDNFEGIRSKIGLVFNSIFEGILTGGAAAVVTSGVGSLAGEGDYKGAAGLSILTLVGFGLGRKLDSDREYLSNSSNAVTEEIQYTKETVDTNRF